MHRHDADLVARDFHVALYLGVGRAQPRHEALQRRRRLALVVQCKLQEFVERVIGLVAEPPQHALPPSVTAEHPRIERKRRLVCEAALALQEARFDLAKLLAFIRVLRE
jgi:hypothetical protein